MPINIPIGEHRTSRRAAGSRRTGLLRRTLALSTAALATVLACAVAPSAQASEPKAQLDACGWNNPGTEHPFYVHCDSRTAVWIQVIRRWPSSDYHRCVGYGKTVLDSNATGAWYDSNFRGGLCSYPGETA
ncbi:DUF6355 family natural product biosynthesis protein [Streptomyces cyaneofuscatus]|uniref:DUF6355 family natural product biosynthesis protein n=1 Tax=Streptomyces cyaneofuscatus TaxID=66883 RepID=UPI0033A043E1